jgi:hypothetical protein
LIWNEFMRKRGWNDEATKNLNRTKRESGLSDRDDIRTMFDYIDADEGKPVREAKELADASGARSVRCSKFLDTSKS